MIKQSPLAERLQHALTPTDRGVVGVVDVLMELCREQGLRFDWRADECRVRPLGPDTAASTAAPLSKSVFRAILARIATLCNQRVPNSVSPYEGEGEFAVDANPPSVFRVAFANTPAEQWLEMRCMSDDENEAKRLVVGEEASQLSGEEPRRREAAY